MNEHAGLTFTLGHKIFANFGRTYRIREPKKLYQLGDSRSIGQFCGFTIDRAVHAQSYAGTTLTDISQTNPSREEPPDDAVNEPLPLGILVGMTVICSSVLLSAVIWAGIRVWPDKQYPSDTPRAVIESAGQMLMDGRADRLVQLIEPVPPADRGTDREQRMNDLYIRLGRVLVAAQDLHGTIQDEMPEELERLAQQIESAEARGEKTSLIAAFTPNRRRSSEDQREARERVLTRLLADPFAGLDSAVTDQIGRVGTQEIGIDTVAITWDNRAVLPPFGLTMRKNEDGWRLVPPTSLPMVKRVMPDSDAEYQVWGSMLATLESLLDDLRRDVDSGRISNIEELRRRAIEDAMIPMGMMMVALGNADEED